MLFVLGSILTGVLLYDYYFVNNAKKKTLSNKRKKTHKQKLMI